MHPGWTSSTQTRIKAAQKLNETGDGHATIEGVDTTPIDLDKFPLSSYFSTVINSATTYPTRSPHHAIAPVAPVTLSCAVPPPDLCVPIPGNNEEEVDNDLYEEFCECRRNSSGSFCSDESFSESDTSVGFNCPPDSPESSVENDIWLYLSDEAFF